MILAVDIGNTTTSFGVFNGRRFVRTLSVPTRAWRSERVIDRRLRGSRGAEEAIVCSVVPWATARVAKALRAAGYGRVRIVGRDVKVPLKNRYTYPEQVGQDRLVGAYAAWTIFGKSRRDCIVADFGTAITIDLVTGRGEYKGGVIAPGLEISLEALATRTALLPKVELKEPPELLGRDTASSIRSGILHGCVALCDGLITDLKRRYAPQAVVVATGGAGAIIVKYAKTIQHLRPHLVLEGLSQLASIR